MSPAEKQDLNPEIDGAITRLHQVGRPVCVCVLCGRVGGRFSRCQDVFPLHFPNRIPDGWTILTGPFGVCQECGAALDRPAAI